MMRDRYYVQHLARGVFLVRECLSADGEPGPDDRIVRSFEVGQDASLFADRMNEKHKQRDEHMTTGCGTPG